VALPLEAAYRQQLVRVFSEVFGVDLGGDPWTSAGICPWQKSDFHRRSAPSCSILRDPRSPSLTVSFYAATVLHIVLFHCWITSVTSLPPAVTHL
jgi:hypothetical protein